MRSPRRSWTSVALSPLPRNWAVALLWSCILVLALPPSEGAGQNRDRGPLVLELPAGTRALAMGNTIAPGGVGSEMVFHHPALLSGAGGLIAGVQWFGSESRLSTFSAGTRWLNGGVALGFQHLSYGASAAGSISEADILALPRDIGSLRDRGDVGVSEAVLSLGYAQTVKGIRMGVVGKLIDQRFGPLEATTAAADVGVSANPGPLAVGLTIQNLGPELGMGGEGIPLPLRFVLGASSRRTEVGPLDVAGATSVVYRRNGNVIPALGMEVSYWPVSGRTFLARLGYRYLPDSHSESPFTFGGAFNGDSIILEYAFEAFDTGDPSHRFSIGWR